MKGKNNVYKFCDDLVYTTKICYTDLLLNDINILIQ